MHQAKLVSEDYSTSDNITIYNFEIRVVFFSDLVYTCEGRRGRGRPRKRWTQDIGEWTAVSTVEAGRQALERGEFRQAVWEATSINDPPYKKKKKKKCTHGLT